MRTGSLAWQWGGPPPVFSAIGAFAGVLLVLVLASGLAMGAPWLPAVALTAVGVMVWCVQRPSRWIYLLTAAIFLESTGTSLYLGGARIRPAQIVLLPAVANLAFFVAGDLTRLRRVPLLAPLVFYLACSFLSALFGPSFHQCFKILLLLISLALLYVVAYTYLRADRPAWPGVFRFFVFIGFLQVAYGLYQVAAGLLNVRLGWWLPIGELGMAHTDYLGTSFGRPYGTLPEPDTYGAVCLFFALLLGLMWFTASNRFGSGRWTFLVAAAALAGLLIGLVRAAWFGFLVGLACAGYTYAAGRIRGIRALRVAAAGFLAFVVVTAAVATSPPLRRVLARRFSTSQDAAETAISLKNARFQQMLASYQLWRQRPLLGNGPGSFSIRGVRGAHEDYFIAIGADSSRLYDPSMLTTLLNDTGLLGVGAFLLLVWNYFGHVNRRARLLPDRTARNAARAGECALVGLFASFVFTHYFWLPFTWLFLAVSLLLFEPELAETASAPRGHET